MRPTNSYSHERELSSDKRAVLARQNTVDYAVPYLNAVALNNDAGLWAEETPVHPPVAAAPPKAEYVNPVAAMAMNETMDGAQPRPRTFTSQEHLITARRQVEEAHDELIA